MDTATSPSLTTAVVARTHVDNLHTRAGTTTYRHRGDRTDGTDGTDRGVLRDGCLQDAT